MPEDSIVTQGQVGASMFFLAKGTCTVWVKDHMKRNRLVNELSQGDYFGEISLITDSNRTATVKSHNYCTLACLSKNTFYELCQNFPDILVKLKKKALEYNDPWKKFKIKMLN